MGRKKKIVDVDEARFSLMGKSEKLELFHDFNQLFHYELSKIPYREIEVTRKGRAELIAVEYYKAKGYDVYRSKVNGGYRCIGVEFYWQDFLSKITTEDILLIQKLKNLMTASEFEELAYLVRDKNGTPDLLLIKDNQINWRFPILCGERYFDRLCFSGAVCLFSRICWSMNLRRVV